MPVSSAGIAARVVAMTDDGAVAHFAAKLHYETDAADLSAALIAGAALVVVDSRSEPAWRQGRVPGAVHLPTDRIPAQATRLLDRAVPVVTYCWGPGCNGSTRSALALASLGFRVREMIGGFEYWAREGLPVEYDDGVRRRPVDPLTAPAAANRCDR
ncbi:MAG: rhodanese-like domain-containing protein [Actinomycetota bacterium]|nr:rhodanese-like domain-containing protein [Actinomycetota bacterium]